MRLAIALTLWFAAATSALGVQRALRISEVTGDRRYLFGVAIGLLMVAWFSFAGWWEMFHN